MFDHSTSTFSSKEVIGVLFKEYDTLRAEIIARTTGAFQLVMVTAIIFTALVSWWPSHSHDSHVVFWIALVVGFIAGAVVFYLQRRDTNKLALRAAQIENEVNHLIARDVMQWENILGGAVTDWLRRPLRNRNYPAAAKPREF